MRKLLTILCLLCLFAPSVSRWAAYLHCKIAVVLVDKNCGCETIIAQSVPPLGDTTGMVQSVQNHFSDWHFEEANLMKPSANQGFNQNNYTCFPSKQLPASLIKSIFRPPSC